MISLARFILKGPNQAALVAAAMAMLAMLPMLFPAAWLSAAAVALVVLVNGPQAGGRVVSYALLGSLVFSWLIFGSPLLAFYFVLMIWLPVWLPAAVLRQTVSLSYSMQILGVLSLLAVLALYLLFPGMDEMFRPAFQQVVDNLAEAYQGQFDQAQLQHAMDVFLQLLPGLFVSSMLIGAMISLFLARWWQAVLYNPGGFGREFRQLQLGKTSAAIATLVILLAWLAPSDMFNAMLMVVFSLYLTQGVAIMHAVFHSRNIHRLWLVFVYGVVFMIPHAVIMLALAGIADAVVDFRRRLEKN